MHNHRHLARTLKFLPRMSIKEVRSALRPRSGAKENAVFQRRKFPRVGQEYQILYTTINKEELTHTPLQSLAVNISGGGVCFTAREALAKDALLALEITAEDTSTILALARVAWCKHKGNGYDVGAEFWWIGWCDSTAQSTMANFIATATRHAAAEHPGAQ